MNTRMIVFDPVYGKEEIIDPLVLELIHTPEMQRLKGVNQYGIWNLFDPSLFTSRFEHSLGVYLLLRKLGASRTEQIAGLLHDISHTAFSHVIDYVFDEQTSQTVHEQFYSSVLFHSQIPSILKKHYFDVDFISNKINFPLLERDLPDLCADRIDYFLRDSLLVGLTTSEEIKEFLSHLTVSNLGIKEGEIVFTNEKIALTMAHRFLAMGEKLWSPLIQSGSYQLMGNILKDALQREIIKKEDFFSTDRELLEKLKGSRDDKIIRALSLIHYSSIREGTPENYTFKALTKARYVFPKILRGNSLTPIVDEGLQKAVDSFKKKIEPGYFIKIVEPDIIGPTILEPVKKGFYRHYKGKRYEVLHTGWHSDSHEEYVVYRGLYDSPDLGKNPVFVREAKEFNEMVVVEGKVVPRFTFVQDHSEDYPKDHSEDHPKDHPKDCPDHQIVVEDGNLNRHVLLDDSLDDSKRSSLKLNPSILNSFKLNPLFHFLKEIEKLKYVERAIMLSGQERYENTAEHTWHMAVMVIVLKEFYPQANMERMLKMALVHDLVEIYAGDTPLYDVEARKTKVEREKQAAEKLFSILPTHLEQEFHDLFNEFEEQRTEEAKVVRGCDELQAVMQNILSQGKTWKEKKLDKDWLLSLSRKKMGNNIAFQQLWDFLFQEIKENSLAWDSSKEKFA